MELIARDLKAQGLYAARALSFAGVEYDILEHRLSEEQIAVYNAYADAWAIIHNNLQAALAATRVTDGFSGATYNSGAKAAALSIFESTKQRRSEEHTSELQSLMRISYAVFCLKKKKNTT